MQLAGFRLAPSGNAKNVVGLGAGEPPLMAILDLHEQWFGAALVLCSDDLQIGCSGENNSTLGEFRCLGSLHVSGELGEMPEGVSDLFAQR